MSVSCENRVKQVECIWAAETRKRLLLQKSHRDRLAKEASLDEDVLRSLDSALKKTTAFMKKIKIITGATAPSLLADLAKLNLSKFVEEIAQGIAEAKLKMNEVAPICDLCVEISSRYARFSAAILTEIKKSLPLRKTDKIPNVAKLKVDLRLLCELILCGVIGKEGMQVLGACLTYLTSTDKAEHANVGLLCTLIKAVGWQIAGIVPLPESGADSEQLDADNLDKGAISDSHKKVVKDMLTDYHSALAKRLDTACSSMNAVQKRVKRQERTRGDASAEDKKDLETCRSRFEELKSLYIELSLTMGISTKVFKEEPSDDEEDEIAASEMNRALAEGHLSLWPDDESRGFYTSLLDIKSIVPKTLYKDSEERTIEPLTLATSVDAIDVDDLVLDDDPHGEEENSKSECSVRSRSNTSTPTEDVEKENFADSAHLTGPELKEHWKKFVENMDHLVNRDAVDQAALDFVSNLNLQSNRKRLVRLLLAVSNSRMDLLPFYARLLTTLSNVMPDVVSEVADKLIKRFREFMVPNQVLIGTKITTVMFISEMVKFGIIPRAEALSCLRQLVYDFRGSSIEMAAAFLECCGFYLFRQLDSHPKMKVIIDVVLKKKERIKDDRYIMLIDNAYFSCVPSEDGPSRRRPEEPPMKQFIRYQVLSVADANVDDRIKCLRRIDWTDSEIADCCIRYLSSPWSIPYSNLPDLASMVTGLSGLQFHEWIAVEIIDALVEMIRLSLEVPGVFNQQALACVSYLGELYNYNACSSAIVFKMLYQLISFPEWDEESWCDFYRVRMVCELISKVEEFFHESDRAKKMDYFLAYFHRYFMFKKEQWVFNSRSLFAAEMDDPVFPAEVEAEFINAMKLIRKNGIIPKNLDQAEKIVEQIENEMKEKVSSTGDNFTEADEEDDVARHPVNRNLHSVPEEEEYGSDEENVNGVPEGEEDEAIHVHVDKIKHQPEDDEFLRELDRMTSDAYRSAQSQGQSNPAVDLSVPTNIRGRFNRTICFSDTPDVKKDLEENKPVKKVALMSRGKGSKAVLKTVSIDEDRLHQSWQVQREREERERADIKRVTLGHTARILAEEQQEEDKKLTDAISGMGRRGVVKRNR